MKLRIVFKEHVMLNASEEIYKTAAQELNHLDEPNEIKRNVQGENQTTPRKKLIH